MPSLLPYQERWPAEYESVAARLSAALRGAAVSVDHIGSTAVPGLLSKDRIDVQVTVANFDSPASILDPLRRLGLSAHEGLVDDHRPPGAGDDAADWRKLFAHGELGGVSVHVHIRAVGRENQRYALVVRDYLRAHPDAAEAYGRLKVLLAAELRDERTYPFVKDPACDLIRIAAEAWAAADRSPDELS